MIGGAVLSSLFYFVTAISSPDDIDRELLESVPYKELPNFGIDESQSFYNYFYNEDFTLSERSLSQLRDHEVILVPGFLAEWVEGVHGYFEPLRNWLTEHGISHQTVQTRSDQNSAVNVETIRKTIMKSSRKVLLMAHSRGGLESLMALVEHPALRSKVNGVVFVQSPFHGTWVADAVYEWCKLDAIDQIQEQLEGAAIDCLDRLLDSSKIFHQDWKSFLKRIWLTIQGMRSSQRQAWMKERDSEIAEIFEELKMPNLVITTRDPGLTPRFTAYEVFRQWMWQLKIPNDGVVPQSSMAVPYMKRVALKESLDHSALLNQNKKRLAYQRRVFSVAAEFLISQTNH